MKERPILFSAPMVRAILSGVKTQTRRVIRPQPTRSIIAGDSMWGHVKLAGLFGDRVFGACASKLIPCPYGVPGDPGDRLWVREAWQVYHDAGCDDAGRDAWTVLRPSGKTDRDGRVLYRATIDEPDAEEHGTLVWRSPIHMPRWASRLTLEIVAVRVERVQDISVADARAEGPPMEGRGTVNGEPAEIVCFDPVRAFAFAWDALNRKRAPWGSNPWVWVIETRRVEQ